MRSARAAALALIVAGGVLASCGDDDDDELGGAPATDTEQGGTSQQGGSAPKGFVCPTYVDGYEFVYNDKGFVINAGGCLFDYDHGTMSYDDSDESTTTFSLNSQGFISRLTEKGDDYTDVMTYEYDKGGRLKSTHETYTKGGETDHATQTFTWQNNNLVRAEWKSEGDVEVYTFTYGDQKKSPLQWTMAESHIDEFDDGQLAFGGLIGVPSECYPTAYAFVYTEDGIEDESGSYTCTYELNEDGTIAREGRKNTGSSYTSYYEFRYGDTRATLTPTAQSKARRPSLRGRLRQRMSK